MDTEELKQRMSVLLPDLKVIADYDEFIQQGNELMEKEQNKMNISKLGRYIGVFLLVEILSSCVWLTVIFFLVSSITSDNSQAFGLTAVSFFVVTVMGIIICYWADSGRKRDAAVRYHTYEDKKREAEIERNVKVNEIIEAIQIIPENYRYFLAVSYMYECLCNCRADTIKEAVNLYEEQLHRWRLENSSEQMLRLQIQQNSDLNNIRRTSAITAAATTAHAINNMLK